MDGYLKWIREKVGREKIILVGAGAVIRNDKGEVLVKFSRQHQEILSDYLAGNFGIIR
jgi:hypothetical protein